MSTVAAKTVELYEIAKGALPSWFFSDEDNRQEIVQQFAKQLANTWVQQEFYIDQVFILRAFGVFLDDLAKDRGTRRQNGETDAQLAARLRNPEDVVTLPALQAKVAQTLTNLGVAFTAADYGGTEAILELRQYRAFYSDHTFTKRCGATIQINCVAASHINDGETFTIGSTVYEFDNASDGVTPGNVMVDINSAVTADDVALAIIAALTPTYGARVDHADVGFVLIHNVLGAVSETVAYGDFKIFRQGSYYCDVNDTNSLMQRFGGNGDGINSTVLVVILPYAITEDQAAVVAEALRQIKAGGVAIMIERRTSP